MALSLPLLAWVAAFLLELGVERTQVRSVRCTLCALLPATTPATPNLWSPTPHFLLGKETSAPPRKQLCGSAHTPEGNSGGRLEHFEESQKEEAECRVGGKIRGRLWGLGGTGEGRPGRRALTVSGRCQAPLGFGGRGMVPAGPTRTPGPSR